MKIIVRADSSKLIGTGHLLRCLSLAKELRAQSWDVTFVCRDLPGNVAAKVRSLGFELIMFQAVKEAFMGDLWLGVPLEVEIEEMRHFLESQPQKPDLLIVDHYSLDEKWERVMAPFVEKIFVIDDLADRSHACDFLLDQSFQPEAMDRYRGKVSNSCELLLGPKFSLLKKEIRNFKSLGSKKRKGEKRIFVFFGGADVTGETLKTLDAIGSMQGDKNPPHEKFIFDIVIGPSNQRAQEIIKRAQKLSDVFCHHDTQEIFSLMAQADLAIGAGGVSTWERLSLGLASIVIVVAKNQLPQITALSERSLIFYLGESDEVDSCAITSAIKIVLGSRWWQSRLSDVGPSLVDGRGVERVCDLLKSKDLTLRAAEARDAELVFEWRNNLETRRYFLDSSPIEVKRHADWFSAVLKDANRDLLIGEFEGRPIGVLRFDTVEREGDAKVSIYLAPHEKGKRLGKALLKAGTHWVKKYRPQVKRLLAEVKGENLASLNAFEGAYYRKDLQIMIKDLGESND